MFMIQLKIPLSDFIREVWRGYNPYPLTSVDADPVDVFDNQHSDNNYAL